ncbi:MAG: hypothetical protein NTV89_14180 [Proteobacteria bacterium]|nr:hypothetical protein [Pseudomonadota bacterium]
MADTTSSDFFIAPSKKSVEDFQALLARDYPVAITEWLKKGWELFKKDAGPSIVFAVIAVIAYAGATFLIPFGIGSTVISIPLLAGFIIIALMLCRNQKTEFVRFFWGFRHLVPLLLFTIVSTTFILIGFLLLVLPGIYVTVAYLFAPYIIVDKNIDFWPAMEISRKKVNKHWFGMAAFCVVLLAINAVACIPLFIGLFVTIPWTIYAVTIAYEDIFKEDSSSGAVPAELQRSSSGPAPASGV